MGLKGIDSGAGDIGKGQALVGADAGGNIPAGGPTVLGLGFFIGAATSMAAGYLGVLALPGFHL